MCTLDPQRERKKERASCARPNEARSYQPVPILEPGKGTIRDLLVRNLVGVSMTDSRSRTIFVQFISV